ncbi:glycosyltransferase [Lonepinella sp. MS14435]|uniref:glycosyltransferase n=1 Tax=Lonepinella sp. MS14435 TaxID=3003618 RepID=UPI0036DD01C2
MKKILINATNLHYGGAIQVASSFLSELGKMNITDFDLSVWASSDVDKNLLPEQKKALNNYKVVDTFGLKGVLSNKHFFDEFDIVFTVFGPCYYPIKGISIVGFAQPWIIYPNNDVYKLLNWSNTIKNKLKFFLQKLFFKRADCLVVELEHVKQRLIAQHIQTADKIEIAYNTVSNIYYEAEKWRAIPILNQLNVEDTIKIGFLGRDYPHKNIGILPKVKEILLQKYKMQVLFYVTLNEQEWQARDADFRQSIYNVGSLDVVQCPYFYQEMDAMIFPSLLECFSATPLETMVMQKKLFASDRAFVRDICKDYASYFDPNDADSIAKVIYEYYANMNEKLYSEQLKEAQHYAMNFSNASRRAEKYFSIIRRYLTK